MRENKRSDVRQRKRTGKKEQINSETKAQRNFIAVEVAKTHAFIRPMRRRGE